MTKPCAEINAALALSKEWTETIQGWVCANEGCSRCYSEIRKFNRYHKDPPDYCGEWEHAGPLLEELVKSFNIHTEVYPGKFQIECFNWGQSDASEVNSAGATLTEAIARAAHALLEGEK